MTDYWVANGHQPNCAYLRSLDADLLDSDELCDCERDDDEEDYRDEERDVDD